MIKGGQKGPGRIGVKEDFTDVGFVQHKNRSPRTGVRECERFRVMTGSLETQAENEESFRPI